MGAMALALVALCQLRGGAAATDGLALTPPMGWRNCEHRPPVAPHWLPIDPEWPLTAALPAAAAAGNFYQGEITQEIMEANMHAMVDRSRTPLGHSAPSSLLDLGYTRACAAPACLAPPPPAAAALTRAGPEQGPGRQLAGLWHGRPRLLPRRQRHPPHQQ